MNKYFKELITLKALDFKLSGGNDLPESIIEASPKLKALVKNVCTPIPLEIDQELEGIIHILGIPKRTFLAQAIYSAMDEAKELMKELNITEYLVQNDEMKPVDESINDGEAA